QYPLVYLQMTQCTPHDTRMSHVCGRKDWVDYLDVTEVQISPVDGLHDLVIDVSLAELGYYVRAPVSRSSEVDNISLHLAAFHYICLGLTVERTLSTVAICRAASSRPAQLGADASPNLSCRKDSSRGTMRSASNSRRKRSLALLAAFSRAGSQSSRSISMVAALAGLSSGQNRASTPSSQSSEMGPT